MGNSVGDAVGNAVGTSVGLAVGYVVGATEGAAVATVGADVGPTVGCAVGADVGTAVGNAVGAGVGIDTHTVSPCFPSVHVPNAHELQRSYTSASWYLPEGQWSQLVLACAAAMLPDAQAKQSLPVLAWNLPTGQSMHDDESTEAKRPLAHAVQLAAL